jgi:hypothetical protein
MLFRGANIPDGTCQIRCSSRCGAWIASTIFSELLAFLCLLSVKLAVTALAMALVEELYTEYYSELERHDCCLEGCWLSCRIWSKEDDLVTQSRIHDFKNHEIAPFHGTKGELKS